MIRGRRRYVLGAVALVGVAVALAPALADTVAAPPHTPNIEAGFHMEGAAQVELVFGDVEAFKKRIDRFYDLDIHMSEARRSFTANVHAAIDALASKRWGCATDALAVPYYSAHTDAANHAETGKLLETEYYAIRKLDRLGETYGLTPEYRSKVNRARGVYTAALLDYQEMRVSFAGQLSYAARMRGCNTKTLRKKGAAGVTPEPSPAWTPDDAAASESQDEPVVSRPVTFFVDNSACPTTLDVYIDGVSMGQVTARAKAAFQAVSGRRALCLIPSTSNANCGELGTLRTAYIHDGWSITMHCQPPPPAVSVLP